LAVIPARLRRLRELGVSGIRQKFADEKRHRELASRVVADLTPPDPSLFAAFGAGSVIVPPARVTNPGCIFVGAGVRIHEHAWISVVRAVEGVVPRLTIGDGTSLGRFAHIACVGEIEIGPEVLASERVFIGDTYHGYEDIALPVIRQPMAAPDKVTIGRGSFLGIGSIVLAGVTIGEQAYVAAGAVVTQDVAPFTVVAGNPARVVRAWDAAASDWLRAGD
jgi:acetyltransferase-like isoleucine patch superfamily enzyme